MGRLHQLALECSAKALSSGALVPLQTERVELGGCEPFVLRRLLSDTPKHLRPAGPKPNPFLPWDRRLQVEPVGDEHLLLLNKYPVQRGHVLLITQRWQPQAGWLAPIDWRALSQVEADTSGLWFFNSCAAAGASQPHRHLQLLPRESAERSCPLEPALEAQLAGTAQPWSWRYRLSRRQACDVDARAAELQQLYHRHCRELELGNPQHDPVPTKPYNLLLSSTWMMTVERSQEHWAGFSVNALGFAGYLLITADADQPWLERQGPWSLLRAVSVPQFRDSTDAAGDPLRFGSEQAKPQHHSSHGQGDTPDLTPQPPGGAAPSPGGAPGSALRPLHGGGAG